MLSTGLHFASESTGPYAVEHLDADQPKAVVGRGIEDMRGSGGSRTWRETGACAPKRRLCVQNGRHRSVTERPGDWGSRRSSRLPRRVSHPRRGPLVAVAVFAAAMPETADTKTERNASETTSASPRQPIVAD
jgi:hypothetical protein